MQDWFIAKLYGLARVESMVSNDTHEIMNKFKNDFDDWVMFENYNKQRFQEARLVSRMVSSNVKCSTKFQNSHVSMLHSN